MKCKMELPKVKKYSHNLKIVLNVFYWAAIIFTCVSLVAAIVIFFLSDSKFILSESNLKQNGFSLDGILRFNFIEVPKEALLKKLYLTILIMSSSIGVLISLVLKQIVLILHSLDKDKPFDKINAKRISTIGTVLIISSFLLPVFEILVAKAMVETLSIQNVSINYTINISMLITGFMLFILSGIFSYGNYLQYEYDETV